MEILISPSFVTVIVVFLIFFVFMLMAGKKIKQYDPLNVDSKFQIIIEMLFESIGNIVEDLLGSQYRNSITPLVITMWVTIFLSNSFGLLLMKEGALDLNYPVTWAFVNFIFWNGYAIKVIGVKNFTKGFFQPLPFMFPLEIISAISTPVSMAIRLFGNTFSGSMFLGLIYAIPGMLASSNVFAGALAAPVIGAIAAPLSFYFSLFGPFIQSMVFTYLTLVNLSLLINEEE